MGPEWGFSWQTKDPCTARLLIEPDAGVRAALGEGPAA